LGKTKKSCGIWEMCDELRIVWSVKRYTLKKGKSAQIRAKLIKADRSKKLLSKMYGAKLSYVSSDEAIVTVTATGRIRAKRSGKCTIYVRALNGISKKVKVIVK